MLRQVEDVHIRLPQSLTQQVVWEFDTESLSSLENILWAASQNSDFVRDYESWYAGLTPLLESAIVELWNRE